MASLCRRIDALWVLASVLLVFNSFFTFGDFYLISGMFGSKGSFEMLWRLPESARPISLVCYFISIFCLYFPIAVLKRKRWFWLLPAQITVSLHVLWALIIYILMLSKTSGGFSSYFHISLSKTAVFFFIAGVAFAAVNIWILKEMKRAKEK